MSFYRFNMRDETQALAQALVAFGMVMLIMIGIAGTVYRVIAPDGWIVQAFERGLGNGLATLSVIALLAASLWLRGGKAVLAKRSKLIEMIVIGFAGAGALFLLLPLLRGVI